MSPARPYYMPYAATPLERERYAFLAGVPVPTPADELEDAADAQEYMDAALNYSGINSPECLGHRIDEGDAACNRAEILGDALDTLRHALSATRGRVTLDVLHRLGQAVTELQSDPEQYAAHFEREVGEALTKA